VTGLRVFHLPSHLTYVSKLDCTYFTPVPSPSGTALTADALLGLDSWGFFDVLHVHTVELASRAALVSVLGRVRREGKGLVFTAHDLCPNIETDLNAFEDKTALLIREARRVVTLTEAAAAILASRYDRRPVVIPHGYAVAPESVRRSTGHRGLLAFGALRPNRRVTVMVAGWRQLPVKRPALHVVLRSIGAADRQRYARELTALAAAAAAEPLLSVETVDRLLSMDELAQRCQHARTLILPYRSITHSGQLELARDMGLRAVAPDVATVRAQLTESRNDHPCVWFPPSAIDDPSAFAVHLSRACSLPEPGKIQVDRAEEHRELLRRYGVEYELSGAAGWKNDHESVREEGLPHRHQADR